MLFEVRHSQFESRSNNNKRLKFLIHFNCLRFGFVLFLVSHSRKRCANSLPFASIVTCKLNLHVNVNNFVVMQFEPGNVQKQNEKKSIHEGPRELALIKITYIGNQFVYLLCFESVCCCWFLFSFFFWLFVRFVFFKWFHFSISNRIEMSEHKNLCWRPENRQLINRENEVAPIECLFWSTFFVCVKNGNLKI